MRLIKDNIWGNIICSELEFKVFSFPLFNRLHYILQNSMAFLVYPSNKTTRFTHSIGVCYVAANIYSNGLKNANNDIVKDFLENKKDFLNSAQEEIANLLDTNFSVEADRYKNIFIKDENIHFELLDNYINKLLGRDFLSFYAIDNNISKPLSFANKIIFQTVRLFALFHDYGHLPFSHLFEFAIEDFFADISDKAEYNDFKDKLKDILDKKDDIHEFIGKKFSILTLRTLQNNITSENNEEEAALKIILELIIYSLKEIHKGRDSKLYSLYEIISSDLDADRIDYTKRDLYSSGLNSHFDADRIIKLYKLYKNEEEAIDDFKFYPPVQALYDIDAFFSDRENLYKMILNHHKVKKFDYILQKLIKIILLNDLKNNQETKDISINNTRDFFNILFKLYKADEIENQQSLIDRINYEFIQLTDYWLLSILRLFLLKIITGDSSSLQDENKIKKLGNELLDGSKNYISLYKREYEFENFIQDLLEDNNDTIESVFENLKDNDWHKEIENQLDILIANIKLPKIPKKLKLIDIKSNQIISYKAKISEYKTKFFIYRNTNVKIEEINNLIKIKIKENINV